MRHIVSSIGLVVSLIVLLPAPDGFAQISGDGISNAITVDHRHVAHAAGQPAVFVENRGQLRDTDGKPRPDIYYYADVHGTRVYVTSRGISYVITRSADATEYDDGMDGSAGPQAADAEESAMHLYRMDMNLDGMQAVARVRAQQPTSWYANYYYGHCPDGILTVRAYRTLIYENVYPAIDMLLSCSDGRVKSEFLVRPGGDPSDIRMRYDGAERCVPVPGGGIRIHSPMGSIEESEALSWTDDGSRVESAFRLEGNTAVFDVGSYDEAQLLTVDPWATYHGGSGSDQFLAVASDAQGYIYASGRTGSTDFPVQAGVQMTSGGAQDAMIVKYSTDGQLLWATYYGGSSSDASASVTPHLAGNIVVGGTTSSTDFPVQNGFQSTNGGGSDSFLLMLNSAGGRIWATYHGGSEEEGDNDGFAGQGLGVDSNGDIYFHSASRSQNLPVLNAYQSTLKGNVDAYLMKVSSSCTLLWATYFGGSSEEHGKGVGVTPQGTVGICGRTTSTDLPLLHEHDAVYQGNSQDGYAAEFSGSGQLLWSSYLGGDGFDAARSMTADNAGALYIASRCQSTDMVTVNPMQATLAGSQDIHIIKYAATPTPQNGRSIAWASYLGGTGNDDVNRGCISVNDQGNIVLVGGTSSADFPVKNAVQPALAGGEDVYVVVMSSYGTIHWSTYYGGTGGDDAYASAFTPANDIVVVGYTSSTDFPLESPVQSTHAGNNDGFLLQLSSQGLVVTPPAAPANLTANAVSPTRVALTWADNSNNETWFVIEYLNATSAWVRIDSVVANMNAEIVVNLQPETEHSFRVRAINSQYVSDPTNVASAITPRFHAPTELQAEAVSSDAVRLTWKDNSDNESRFVVERAQGPGVWDEIDQADADMVSHIVLGLQPSTSYTFRLKAVEGIVASGFSNEAEATTWMFLPAPSNLVATVITETEVRLDWEDNADGESNYEVEQQHEAGPWVKVATLPANATGHTLQGLTPRTHYAFRVRATGTNAASSWSNEAHVLTKTKPAVPLAFECSAMDHRTVAISWLRGSENEDGYEIQRQVEGGDWSFVHTAGPGDGNLTDEHLEASTAYRYRIHAVNDVGASAWAEDTAVTYPMPVPDRPFGLMAAATGPYGIRLTWVMPDPSFEEHFELQESPTGDEADYVTLVPSPDRGARAYDHEGLLPESTHWYRIRAVNGSGASEWSKIASATTLREEQKIPVVPFNVTATALSDTEIRVDWSMPDPTLAEGFEFERSLTGDPADFTAVQPDPDFDERSYTDAGLAPKTTYWYRLRAYNTHGTSPYSAIVSATTLKEPLSPELLEAMDAKEAFIVRLEQLRVAGESRLGDLRTALGDYARGYDETVARGLLAAWRSEQPDGVQNAISALERYTLLEQTMLDAVGSEELEAPVPGAMESARQATLAPASCAKDLLALGIAWHEERDILGGGDYSYLDRAMQDMSFTFFDAAQTMFMLSGTEQGAGLLRAFAEMQRSCCGPTEITHLTIPLVPTYYQELFLIRRYVGATQRLIPEYAMQTANIWYSGSYMDAQQKSAAFIDGVRTSTEGFVQSFEDYRSICYGLDAGYTISSTVNSSLSVFMRKMTVLKPALLTSMWRAVDAIEVPVVRAQFVAEQLPAALADAAVTIFDPSAGVAGMSVPRAQSGVSATGVDRAVLDTDRDALEALRAEVLLENASYMETEYDALRDLGHASVTALDAAQRPLLGISPGAMLAEDEGTRGDYYRTMALVQQAKARRSVLAVSLADYILDAQEYKVTPLVAEIDSIIGSLYGAADGIDEQLNGNGGLVSLPVLALDATGLQGRSQDGPRRYRLSILVKNVGGADAEDADVLVEVLSAGVTPVSTGNFATGAIAKQMTYGANVDLDIEPGTETLKIAVSMTLDGGGTWTDIRSIPVPDISTGAGRIPAAEEIVLEQNYPNPFNPTTTIRYSLPRSMAVTLVVTDPLGREVRRLVDNEHHAPGPHAESLDAGSLPSGVYFYRLVTPGQVHTRRMLLLR